MKAGGLSVDVGQVLVVSIEVSPGVEPGRGVGVRVGAHLEPPGTHTRTPFEMIQDTFLLLNTHFKLDRHTSNLPLTHAKLVINVFILYCGVIT